MSSCINRKKLIFFISIYMIIYNFKKFINFVYTLSVLIFTCNKKDTVESRDIRLIFLSRSTERQAGHDGKTVVIDSF